MENENNENLELENNEGGEAEIKPKFTPEQERGMKQRQFKKLAKELGVELPQPEPVKPEPKVEKNSFDYGEMAYLEAKGITDDDYPIILEAMKATGKSLRDTVGSKYVQNEIKEAKDIRTSKDALPTGTNRAGTGTKDSVDFWVAQGKLPPAAPENAELRAEVQRELVKKASVQSQFTDNPVV